MSNMMMHSQLFFVHEKGSYNRMTPIVKQSRKPRSTRHIKSADVFFQILSQPNRPYNNLLKNL